MEFLEGFLVTDIYLVIGYKLPTIQLPPLFHKLHGMGRDDSAKALLKIPSKLQGHCLMRITPIRFFIN
ncbi:MULTISPECIES: hypothetical protein [unclassified Prochlorococcus]|uniref:hypothetical protein n=1 Tax=unclassified Prochlorococcus TaxID=2627481 RepID=UPI00097CC801|nr:MULTISPECIES: hypothetical protein [unclassified Prochlorococcus]AQL29660.1 hypothetical protein BSR22_00030 [Prochlorococcus sp. RS50]AQL31709.1 hypothetical protein BS620_01445 [Prochlorococcus sp. RS01]AQL34661.1 hypothetical protein BS621_07765 [Prochlorococcus sp. RS04]